MGSNQQPLDFKSNALSTALPRKICEVGFKHCTVHRYSIAQCYTSLQNRAVDQLHQACHLLKQKILPLMKLGELYVHIYYYTLNDILYIKLLCMHDAMTCNIVAILSMLITLPRGYEKCPFGSLLSFIHFMYFHIHWIRSRVEQGAP